VYNTQNYWVSGLCPSSGQWTKSRNPVILEIIRFCNNNKILKGQQFMSTKVVTVKVTRALTIEKQFPGMLPKAL
jgi:hypothetical protein